SGGSQKAYTNLDNASNDKSVGINPNGVALTAKISGTVYNDLNGNGVFDTGEPGLPNVTVTATSGTFSTTAITNANGLYSFTGLTIDPGPTATYTLDYAVPTGFVNTGPRPLTVTVAQGDTNINNNF